MTLNDSGLPLPARFRIEVLIPDYPGLQEWMGGLSRDCVELKALRTQFESAIDEWLYDQDKISEDAFWVEVELEPERCC